MALVAGRTRVPKPATGSTAFRSGRALGEALAIVPPFAAPQHKTGGASLDLKQRQPATATKCGIRLEFSFFDYDVLKPRKLAHGVSRMVTVVTDDFSSAPQSTNCHQGNLLLTDRRRSGSSPQMSPSNTKATMRMVMASFAAGAGAMVLVGLVAPVAMKGGLTIRDAMASSMEDRAQLIEPLDVAAIEAQLAEADRSMDAMRANTADEMNRLEQLSGH
jgi:hypothetical protein